MIFNSPARITQYFGENPEYYSIFYLLGHDGLDIVPTGMDWTVNAGVSGKVVAAYESSDYGLTIITFDPLSRLAVRYAHLAEYNVDTNYWLKQGERLGVMGDTGNTTGSHLHVHCVPMIDEDKKMYPDNGYKGRFDILPLLKHLRMI